MKTVLKALCLLLLSTLSNTHGTGPCTVNVDPLDCFSYDDYCAENAGLWRYRMIPDVEEFCNTTYVFQSNDPLANQGVYWSKLYSINEDAAEPWMWGNQIRSYLGGGLVIGKPIRETDIKYIRVHFLHHEPGFAVFYKCREDAEDGGVDYRFVLSHCELTEAQYDILDALQEKYQFRGCLKTLR